ncbi:antibiotic biosynthesis monooxygenase [Streptomyces drozdowiczii]|uniref:Antibiotic biosynthesis monooxygenase n=1 Tax=Streptomyces drozdowiczii TaxID=202862 RepID=A0ABY6Q2Q4_9ACTN|nr:antibiotic biosynthesis monooxygenase [Streptomyces drozdowiczii]MCX0247955.1 antibiotic biosynthesis monooxygenase [Streptomyces drozdowiczii]UZK58722.1 antibiotic biosynthesis monooxygenase [Streptomyces drozdowiczii]
MTGGFALMVRFALRDSGAAQGFDELVEQAARGIRREPGTVIYTVHAPVNEPLVRIFYELYADRAAFQAHEEAAHTKQFLAAREQYLVSTEVTFLDELRSLSKRPETEGP